MGPFLWSDHHPMPAVTEESETRTIAILNLPGRQLRRAVEFFKDSSAWKVRDSCFEKDGSAGEFTVHWQLAPDSYVKRLDERRFLVRRHDVEIKIEVSEGWSDVSLVEMDELQRRMSVKKSSIGASGRQASGETSCLAGTVSPAFRKMVWAPYLKLVARPKGDKPCVFSTTFLASAHS
jgi:hypothetical protein